MSTYRARSSCPSCGQEEEVWFHNSKVEPIDIIQCDRCSLVFDPADFIPTLRQDEKLESVLLGFHHAFTTRSDLIGSLIYQNADFGSELEVAFTVPLPPPLPPMQVLRDIDLKTDEDGYIAEVQHLFRHEIFSLISGVGHFDADSKDITTITTVSPPPITTTSTTEESDISPPNVYVYSLRCICRT